MRYTREEGTEEAVRGPLALVMPRISLLEPMIISWRLLTYSDM